MYCILVYDINLKRLNKVYKTAKQYLNWVQNSVFEGELSNAQLKELKDKINEIINKNEDSVVFYELRSEFLLLKNHFGIDKSWLTSNFIE